MGADENGVEGGASGDEGFQVEEGGSFQAAVAFGVTGEDYDLQAVGTFLQEREDAGEAAGVGRVEHIVEHDELPFHLGEHLPEREADDEEDRLLFTAGKIGEIHRLVGEFRPDARQNKVLGQAHAAQAGASDAAQHVGGGALDRGRHGGHHRRLARGDGIVEQAGGFHAELLAADAGLEVGELLVTRHEFRVGAFGGERL